jgi:protein gp37
MIMQKTKIEWTDMTWNPVKGKCPVGCSYCYARRMYDRFKWDPEIRLDEKELLAPYKLKKPNKIFVFSTIEPFINAIRFKSWIPRIFGVMDNNKQHTFQLLTKFPKHLQAFYIPRNLWTGTTITCQRDNSSNLHWIKQSEAIIKFNSFEPLHSKIECDLEGIDWIIIGAETGNRKGKIIPKREWIEGLINQAKEHNIPIFLKDNLKEHWDGEWYREFPKGEK